MAFPIRVHTLTLPMQDWIASWILSNQDYVILRNERQMTKEGDFIMHLQYEDHMGLGYDYFTYLMKAQTDETEKEGIMRDMDSQFIDVPDDDVYVLDEPKPPARTAPKKAAKGRKKVNERKDD